MGMKIPSYVRVVIFMVVPVCVALAIFIALPANADDVTQSPDTHQLPAVTTQQEIDRIVAAQTGMVLVDFHASWCGPCRKLAPELQALAATYPTQITVLTVDVDAAPELAQRYEVATIPHLVLLRPGQPMQSRMGFAKRDVLATWAGLSP